VLTKLLISKNDSMNSIKKIDKIIKKLPEGWIVLIRTTSEKSSEISLNSIKLLTGKTYTGIVVSANRPYQNLSSIYKSSKIDMEKIFVIDCVSKGGQGTSKSKNVLYSGSISSLTDISLLISRLIGKIKGKKFLFIDSISTMMIHNEPNVFARFMHSLITLLRIKEINGMLFTIDGKSGKEIEAEIAQLCDHVISV
jgi:hypothetical protein